MLRTVEAVYIYIIRFNKKEELNIENIDEAMYFRRT